MNSLWLITRISKLSIHNFGQFRHGRFRFGLLGFNPKFLLLDVIETNCRDKCQPSPQNPKGALDATGTGRPGVHDFDGRINFAGILRCCHALDSIDTPPPLVTRSTPFWVLTELKLPVPPSSKKSRASLRRLRYQHRLRHLFPHRWLRDPGGGYRAFNRSGMETVASPFLKMTFETTVQYLKMLRSLVKRMSSFRLLRESFWDSRSHWEPVHLKFVNQFTNKLLIRLRLKKWIAMIYYQWEH